MNLKKNETNAISNYETEFTLKHQTSTQEAKKKKTFKLNNTKEQNCTKIENKKKKQKIQIRTKLEPNWNQIDTKF